MSKRMRCSPEVEAFNYVALGEDPDFLVEKCVHEDIGTCFLLKLNDIARLARFCQKWFKAYHYSVLYTDN